MTGGRHARRAALPPAGFARERQLGPAALTVTVPGESGGTEGVFDFSVLPGPRPLLAACAEGFARLAGPDQPWRAAATCTNGYKAIREFLRHAAALDPPPATPEDITPAVWAAWRLSRPATVWGRTCLLITRQWLPMVPAIPPVTAAAAARRIPSGPAAAEAAYTREEFEQIKTAAAGTFRAALSRIRESREHLRRWRDGEFPQPGLREQYRQTRPGTAGYLTGEALDVLLRTGDVPLNTTGDRRVLARHARALGGAGPEHTWARLFLTMREAAALTVLLVCDQGWNRSVLDAMTVPDDMPGAGEDGLDIYRVPVLKRRRPASTRHTSVTLADAGPGPSGRLIRQAIEVTEPARLTLAALGEPTSRLLVSRRAAPAGKSMFCLGVAPRDSVDRWAASAGLARPGGPGQVSLRRLRRTVQVLIRREPAQNTEQTHEQVYVLRDPATRPEAEQVTAQGLSDAVGHARQVMRMRMLLDAGTGELTECAGSPEQAQALANGVLDTATGACLDYTHGPFSPPGQPCTASFLDCLACRNAVATRRHLPRLAWLHRALDELRGTVDAAVWAQDWRTHFLRLTAPLDDNTTPAERDAAARAVSDADRELIRGLLTGRYTA
ncbi:MAG TPA: hypothetical protein VGF32_23290 [Streptosporangiaceae bacterium]